VGIILKVCSYYYLQEVELQKRLRMKKLIVVFVLLFQALCNTHDKEIFELLTSTYNEKNTGKRGAVGSQLVIQRAQIILEEVKQLGLFTRLQCLEYIGG
jgi:DNA-directed RNA polymerase I subunit RPA2